MNLETLKELAGFGGTGVALVLAYVLWRLSETVIKSYSNHINHNTQMLTKLECAIQKLCKKLK